MGQGLGVGRRAGGRARWWQSSKSLEFRSGASSLKQFPWECQIIAQPQARFSAVAESSPPMTGSESLCLLCIPDCGPGGRTRCYLRT